MTLFDDNACIVIETGKKKSEDLAEAMRAGWPQRAMIVRDPEAVPEGFAPIFIGMRPQIAALIHGCREAERPFLTIDNGYFRPYKQGGYFRATVNALQVSAPGTAEWGEQDPARWNALNLDIEPWRGGGDHILLVLQSESWYQMVLGEKRVLWVHRATNRIAQHTGRTIRIRDKPLKGRPPVAALEDDLRDCHAVAGLSSALLLEAQRRGFQTLAIGESAASHLAAPISRLDAGDWRPERAPHFAWLANNQWTAEEMASGRLHADLAARHHRFDQFRLLA